MRRTRATALPAHRLASASPTPPLGDPRRRLPRGASSLPAAEVEAEQRKRLVTATAQVVAAKGYADATVADIVAAAGVSRATFYALFRDKEACFLHGFDQLAQGYVDAVERAIDDHALPLPERLHAALAAYLGRIDSDRPLARAFIAEAEAATPRSRAAFRAAQQRLSDALQRWLDAVRAAWPQLPPSPPDDLALVMHGLAGHVVDRVRRGLPFDDAQVHEIWRFVLAGLGLYGWAGHVQRLGQGHRGHERASPAHSRRIDPPRRHRRG
jgi:AcrR family transcriptional regulator